MNNTERKRGGHLFASNHVRLQREVDEVLYHLSSSFACDVFAMHHRRLSALRQPSVKQHPQATWRQRHVKKGPKPFLAAIGKAV